MRSSDFKRVCANCKWWVPENEADGQFNTCGSCHRYPPTGQIFDEFDGCAFTQTECNDWCGEFVIMQHPRMAAAPSAKFANAPALALGA